MVQDSILKQLPGVLLPWYRMYKRDLPWRADREPYHIWISEIMLQQTRVEAVRGYYLRFLEAFPTVTDLAYAEDDRLHKLWEGLGYYSRVRNLKRAAQIIVAEYRGQFPRAYKDIIALPGIGAYTAGAICSIAFNQPTPAVDGNVLRVVARLLNNATPVDTPSFKSEARERLLEVYPADAGDFTQALMELGATVCGPNRKPDCLECPCAAFCQAYQCATADRLPIKQRKKNRRKEERTVFILECDGSYALEKRSNRGLLAGLWQFPNVAGSLNAQTALTEVEKMGLHPREMIRTVQKKHVFTHVEWDMCGVYMKLSEQGEGYRWFTADEIQSSVALPTAFRLFWEER